MLRWKNEYAPRYALFLKGARRVGKTTLAKRLAEEYRSSVLIRFDEANSEVKQLFTESLMDLDNFFTTLQGRSKSGLLLVVAH